MKAYSEFTIPQNGQLILLNKNYNKFYEYLFRSGLSFFITLFPLLFLKYKFQFDFTNGYSIYLPILFFVLIYYFLFKNANEEIKSVKYFEDYLSIKFGNANIKVEYSEINFFSFDNKIDKSDGRVKIFFNENSQLYNVFKKIGSNDLFILNDDLIKVKGNVDLINFLHNKIKDEKIKRNLNTDSFFEYDYLQ